MSQRAYVVAVISFCTTQETIRLLNGSNGRDNITGIISLNKHTLCNSKEVVMHYINEFLFDSARLLLFRDTVSEDTILNVTREYAIWNAITNAAGEKRDITTEEIAT